jgi:hypothetical protein
VRRGTTSRGWRGSGWLSPVEAVGGVAWTKFGAEEERRGRWGSSAGGTTRRKEKGRPRLGHATRRRMAWGASGVWCWKGSTASGGGRRSARRGSAREGRGRRGGPVGVAAAGPLPWARPRATVPTFDLNEFSN